MKYLITLFILSLLVSCYYDNEEDLFANIECKTENLSYNNDIRPILVNNCMVCHSNAANQGNVRFQQYEDLTTYIINGKLIGSVRHDPGFIPMPGIGNKMNACDISRIESWIADGFPNN